jgi:Peptidase A4 family
MHFVSILSAALLATSALAAPHSSNRLSERVARRSGSRRTTPPKFLKVPHHAALNGTGPQYSQNWAGSVITSPPSGSSFTGVSATFVVPTPKAPSGSGSGSYAASAWVGIDGDTYNKAILQTGVDFTVHGGEASFDAWYEWYPAVASDFSGIPIKAGDTISLSVTATTSTSGTAVIKNVSTGKTVTKALTSSSKLGGQNAEWIVEDFEEGSSLVPFANFGAVEFTGASYTTSSGATGGPGSGTILDIRQSGKVLTSASETDDSVTVTYV